MADVIAKIKTWLATPAGRIVQALVYTAMAILILIYFDGRGEFIYEGF